MRSGPVRSGAVMSCDEQWSCVLRLPRERQPGSYLYSKGSQEALCTAPATRKPAAGQRRPCAPQLLQETLRTAPASQKGNAEALRTAPAGKGQPRASGAHARRTSSSRLCLLRLPRQRQPGSYLYCVRRDSQPRARGAHARRSSSRRLCVQLSVLRLPRESQPRASGPPAPQLLQQALCTAPATPKAARKLSVLRLPRQRQPGSYLYSE